MMVMTDHNVSLDHNNAIATGSPAERNILLLSNILHRDLFVPLLFKLNPGKNCLMIPLEYISDKQLVEKFRNPS